MTFVHRIRHQERIGVAEELHTAIVICSRVICADTSAAEIWVVHSVLQLKSSYDYEGPKDCINELQSLKYRCSVLNFGVQYYSLAEIPTIQ